MFLDVDQGVDYIFSSNLLADVIPFLPVTF